MDIDWTLAKAKTLWQYEELIAKLRHVLAYGFVREHYNHNMTDAAAYAKKLQNGYLLNGKRTEWLTEVSEQLLHFDLYRVSSYSDFVQHWQLKSVAAADFQDCSVAGAATPENASRPV